MKLSEVKEYVIREYGAKRWEEVERDYIYEIYNSSTEERIERLMFHGEFIRYINIPTKREQKVAIKQNWRNIQYIDNPSEEIKLYAIKQNGDAIQYIENPSEELKLLAVKICYLSLQYIHNPSDELLKEALKNKNSIIDMLKHIKNDLKGRKKRIRKG